MTTMILLTPYLAFFLGVAMMIRALHLYSEARVQSGGSCHWQKIALLLFATTAFPSLAHAQGVDLKTAAESGNAIIMYLSGIFAAIGIISAGIAMRNGRHDVAKWSFAGAMVAGMAFAIVRAFWSSMGMTASDVGAFAP